MFHNFAVVCATILVGPLFSHSGHVLNEDRLTVSEYRAAAAQPAASLKTSTQYSVAAKLRLAATGWWRGAALGR